MTAHPLDHGLVADAEAEDEAIIIEAGQGAQAAPGGERVAGIVFAMELPMIMRVVFASMKLAMERDSYPSASGYQSVE